MWHDRNRGVKSDPKASAGAPEIAKPQESKFGGNQELSLGHIKLEMPLDIQVKTLGFRGGV